MSTREGATRGARRSRSLPVWAETILLLVIALLVSAVVKTFFVQMFFVPSGSMRPLFVDNDRILVQKISYWTGDVKRGDVVVFDDPGGRWLGSEQPQHLTPVQKALSEVGLYPTGGHLVKRVIGIGGDRVRCCDRRGRVTVNGVPLQERSYLMPGSTPSDRRFDITVPKGRLWVMGDNRGNSEDSRFHQDLPGRGTVPAGDVVGKVWAIVWPFGRAHLLHEPATFESPRLAATGSR
jgi:signal peptidase I